MQKTSFYFSLAPYIYATCYDDAVIILDSKADKYLSLIDDAARSLCFILKHKFVQNENGLYCPLDIEGSDQDNGQYDYWISYFIEKKFIIHSTQATVLTEPLQSGGLIGYRWDLKSSWRPFSQTSLWEIVKAYYMLIKVHKSMKHKGVKEIIDLIKKHAAKKNCYNPSEKEIQRLSAAVDAASLLYLKKTLCLAWASTFVLLALQRNWKINLVFGVQTNPFYAHAWAETSCGKVINDDPLIAQVLSIIFKEPYIEKDF